MLVKRINRHHAEKSSSASYHNIILKLIEYCTYIEFIYEQRIQSIV